MNKNLKKFLAMLCMIVAMSAKGDVVNGDKKADVIIFSGGSIPRLVEVQPEGWYYHDSHMLTVEFPATDFEPYTLSVSSTLTTLDYYVTTPYVCVPILLTGLTYDIQLETDAGDVYWGVLDLSEATSME